MKILRNQPGIGINWGGGVEAGHVKRVVVHDVVEVDADSKPVRDFDHAQQVCFGAVTGADRSALIFAAEIESVPQIVTDRKSATAFRWWRQPE